MPQYNISRRAGKKIFSPQAKSGSWDVINIHADDGKLLVFYDALK